MIEFKNATVRYANGYTALNQVSFKALPGETTCLIGPSGCGKTTTLKTINRLIQLTSGSVSIDGSDNMTQDPINLRRKTGYVSQQDGLFPHMTVGQNVSIVAKLLKWDEKQIKERSQEILNTVNLPPETFAKKYPTQLSGGQQQRVNIARALMTNPNVILWDEPFSALDPITRRELQDEFLHIQQKFNKTMILVTHDIAEAFRLADKVIILSKGTVQQQGTPQEIQDNPASAFVEEFISQH